MNRSAADWLELARVRALGVLAVLLAGTSISPLIDGWDWLGDAAQIMVCAALVNWLVSGVLGQSVGSVAGALAGVATLNALYGLSLLPTWKSLVALWSVLQSGAESVYALPPPIPDDPGSRALVAIGLAFAWWFVDLLAGATATPAAAGVPLVAILLPTSMIWSYGVPWWSFLLAALGYLLLLTGSEAVAGREWGRLVGPHGRSQPLWGPDGLPVIAAAVTVALVVPALLPGLATRIVPPGAFGDDGDDTIAVLNPILDLREDLRSRSDAPVLTYQTTAGSPQLIRVLTVDDFDGRVWQPTYGKVDRRNRVQAGLPQAPGLLAGTPAQPAVTTITIERLRQTSLPAPYPATKVDVSGNWLYDPATLNIFGDRGTQTQRNQRYTVEHQIVTPSPESLREAPRWLGASAYTGLPSNLPQEIVDTARQIAGSGSDYDRAMRLQTWLRSDGGFTYSLNAPPQNGSSAIVDFLERKSGYCVHFASTMAVMARALGIPARIGVGFQVGQANEDGTWVVRERDAHAWPELYFEGAGWVRFEPTPAVQVPSLPTWAAPTVEPTTPATTTPTPTETPTPTVTAPLPEQTDTAEPTLLGRVLAVLQRVSWPLTVVILLLAFGVALPAFTAAAHRRRRWRRAGTAASRAEASWDELLDSLDDLGLTVPPSATVRQTAGQVADRLEPSATTSLTLLAERVELTRYSADENLPDLDERAELSTVLRSLRRSQERSARWRARLLPRSGIRRLLGIRQNWAARYAGWRSRRGGRYRSGR